MNLIELKVVSLYGSQAQISAYVLVLQEMEGERKIPILVGTAEAQAILIKMRNIKSPRPMTHDLFTTVIQKLGGKLTHIVINEKVNGIYHAQLYINQNEKIKVFDSRSSDAVALALWSQSPIFINEDVLKQITENETENDVSHEEKAIWDLNAHHHESHQESLQELENKLQDAINSENYEQAANIRDLINKLKP